MYNKIFFFVGSGNFIDGELKYFGASFYKGHEAFTPDLAEEFLGKEGYDGPPQHFYFGLFENHKWENHGILKYKNGGQGWLLETAKFEIDK